MKELTSNQPAPNHIQEVKKEEKKQDGTSPVRDVIAYFSLKAEEAKGFRPEISGKRDGGMVKRFLKKHLAERAKNQVDFFLESKKAEFHLSLSAALSADTSNQCMNEWAKRCWRYSDQAEPPVKERWWT